MKHLPPIKVLPAVPAKRESARPDLVLRVGPKNPPKRNPFVAPQPAQVKREDVSGITKTVTGVAKMPSQQVQPVVVQKLPPGELLARTRTRHRDAPKPIVTPREPVVSGSAVRVKVERPANDQNYRVPEGENTMVAGEQFTPYRTYDASNLNEWQSTEQVKFWWAVGERHARAAEVVRRELSDDERNSNIEAEISLWRKTVLH